MMRNSVHVVSRLLENWPIKAVWSALAAFFSTYIWGNITPLYAVWFAMYLMDFVTGVSKAIHQGEFNSAGLKRGFAKWAGYSLTAGMLALATNGTHNQTTGWLWRWVVDWTLFYIIFQEYVSICENLSIFGIHLPTLKMLGAFSKKMKDTVSGTTGRGQEKTDNSE